MEIIVPFDILKSRRKVEKFIKSEELKHGFPNTKTMCYVNKSGNICAFKIEKLEPPVNKV